MRSVITLVELLMNRHGVTDIAIGPQGAWIDTGSGFVRESDWPFSESDHRNLAFELISSAGRHIDVATPFADVRLRDGVRVHAIIPPASVGGTSISIRIPAREPPRLERLVESHMLSKSEAADALLRIRDGRSFLIAGTTGSGKTTLAAALLAEVSELERIVTIEDVAELRIAHPHVVSLQARQPNIEGAGAIDLSALVRQSLRMRPDRIVVGEIRGAEIVDVMLAHTSGHPGGSTVHARSLTGVPARLALLGQLAGVNPREMCQLAVAAFDDVYVVERTADGRRLVERGGFVRANNGDLAVRS